MGIPYNEQENEEYFASIDSTSVDVKRYDEGIYDRENINELLEDDELSFEEAAFMTGYCDFA